MIILTIIAISCFVPYLLFGILDAFISWNLSELNPGNWDQDIRFVSVTIAFFSFIILLAAAGRWGYL